MSSSVLAGLIAVGIVAVLAIVMRALGGRNTESVQMPPPTVPDDAVDEDALDDDSDETVAAEEPIPMTAEGVAVVADGAGIRLIPLVTPEQDPPGWIQEAIEASSVPYSVLNHIYMPGARGTQGAKPGTPLNAGDFTAARIRPGVAGAYSWRLETLGRDGDYGFFPFETEQGARVTLAMMEARGIVQKRRDQDGEAIPPSAEDFEEARRLYEETERALAIGEPEDEAS